MAVEFWFGSGAIRRAAGLAVLCASLAQPAPAADLAIGLLAAPTSLDPHFEGSTPNINALAHLYDCLVEEAGPGDLRPGLALSWRAVDATTWEFVLRPGVRFHDGTPLAAEDIAFSLQRVRTVPNSPNPLTPFVRAISSVEVAGPDRIRVRTAAPYPFLPRDMAYVRILSRRLHEAASTSDFNVGRAAIGTGPYQLEGFTPRDRLALVRNPDWFGAAQPWDRVLLREIPANAARLAALLAGEIDLIERVGPSDLPRLRANPQIRLASVPGGEVLFLFPDSARDATPFVRDSAGQPLGRNPLRDLRVRRAISLALDRPTLAERVLQGAAVPASQLNAPGSEGRDETLPELGSDPAEARRLLAEAGYPDGFSITLHGTRGLYPNDAQLLQAIAQLLSRVGIRTEVDAMPQPVFVRRANEFEFSLYMLAYNSTTAASTLRGLLMTRDPPRGFGTVNRMRYSNPELDRLMLAALGEMDDASRARLLGLAQRAAVSDLAAIPLVATVHSWASRAGKAVFEPSPLGRTRAMAARPAS
ncbi:MAG: ABC transporter substrate-binding protein [Alphaproteobacteria bacterium]|nr:ABC transporter substrate-binding protein [Alphaproteobacteria bacterium]